MRVPPETPHHHASVPHDLLSRERLVTLAVVTTFLSLLPTAYVAGVSNSITLYADLLRCLGEFFAIVVAFTVLKKVSRNETRRFNYGYGKLEQLAGIAVAAALFLTFLVSFFNGVHGVISPAPLEGAQPGLILAGLSILGNGAMWGCNFVANLRTPSAVSESQARLFRAKTFATLVVCVSLAGGLYLPHHGIAIFLDPLGSIVLSLFMLHQAYTLVSASVPDLIDYAIEEGLQRSLEKILQENSSLYATVKEVRSRRSGRRIHIEIVATFDGALPFSQVHRSMMSLRELVGTALPGSDVTIIPGEL
jgi:cation diffusion facilitator family transporter